GALLTQEQEEWLCLHNVGGPVRGLANFLPHKAYHNRQFRLQGSYSGNSKHLFLIEPKQDRHDGRRLTVMGRKSFPWVYHGGGVLASIAEMRQLERTMGGSNM
ncbi:hypothetical protein HAX54_039259, partial [Datura stramonium]|nr:hypothetical protein [Datura stramonium]